MHALLITFRSATPPDALAAPLAAHAALLRGMPGLITRTWLHDGAILGGFYVFAGRRAAEGYLASELVASLIANPAFSEFRIRHFGVLEDLRPATGTVPPASRSRRHRHVGTTPTPLSPSTADGQARTGRARAGRYGGRVGECARQTRRCRP
jgi:hypothetical protein